MDAIVYRRIPRAKPEILAALAAFPVADLHEALGALTGAAQLMSAGMRPVLTGARIVGQAITARNYPGDNLMIHAALNVAEAGDILVLSNGGTPFGALWGDVATTWARRKDLAGVVADGPVRDTAELRKLNFPVWSTHISPSHPEKRGPGAVNVPLICGGVRVMPGDFIVADDDGVLVVPRDLASSAVEAAARRNQAEAKLRQAIAEGRSLFELLNIQKLLDQAGIRSEDGCWHDAAQNQR